jgi:hypothetical protein
VTGLLLWASCGSMAFVFGLMWVTGSVKVCEPNLAIRAIELLIALGLSTYGGVTFLKELRRAKRQHQTRHHP